MPSFHAAQKTNKPFLLFMVKKLKLQETLGSRLHPFGGSWVNEYGKNETIIYYETFRYWALRV